MVIAWIVGLVPLVVVSVLQHRLGQAELMKLGMQTSSWLLMLPGMYWGVLLLFTVGHAVWHRARIRHLRWWIAAIALLQIPAIICYWIRELVETCSQVPIIDGQGK